MDYLDNTKYIGNRSSLSIHLSTFTSRAFKLTRKQLLNVILHVLCLVNMIK